MARWVFPVPVPPISTTLRWSATKLPCQLSDESFVHRGAGEIELFDILGQRQLGDGHLVADRARLLLGNLRLQQVADNAGRLVLALDAGGHDLVIGAAHSIELQCPHQVENLGAFHVGWSS